ncbi:MAG: hypothetical protein KBT00_08395 [Bacteroidales bacterium]|nr:hypothetical protein [Candidatus Cacconaster merdequi]
MKRRTIKGDIIEDSRMPRNHLLECRVTDEEFEKIHVLMEKNGYFTVSSLIRDMLFKKNIVSKKVIVRVTDKILRDKLNEFIFQANKIGVNYNQFVATYQRQAKMTGPDGKPYLSGRNIEEKVISLMRLTEEMRDEIAVIIDIFERYTQDNT